MIFAIKKIIMMLTVIRAGLCKHLSNIMKQKISLDYCEARRSLEAFSPRPQGRCYCNKAKQKSIKYDLQVIITAYNDGRYISSCLHSIRQLAEYNQYKILIQVIDDGSIDDTWSIIDEFENHQLIDMISIHQDNKGLSSARNVGLNTIFGEYIMFIDGDDCLPEHFDFKSFFETSRMADITQGNWSMINNDGKIIGKHKENHIAGFAWGKVYHHGVFESFYFPEGFLYEDTPITFVLCGMNNSVNNYDGDVYCYRKNKKGISSTSINSKKSIDSYWITELCLEEFFPFGVDYDQRAYEYFLRQTIINHRRIRKQPRMIRKCVFVLTSNLIDKYFFKLHSKENIDIEDAIRNRQFMRFELLTKATSYRCLNLLTRELAHDCKLHK